MIKDDGPFVWLDILVENTKWITVKVKDELGNEVKQKIEKPDGYGTISTRFHRSAIGMISPAMKGKKVLKTRSSFYDRTTDSFYTTKCSVEDLHRHTKAKPITGFKVGK